MLKDLVIKRFEKEKEKNKYDKMKFRFSDEIEIQENNGEKKHDKIKR